MPYNFLSKEFIFALKFIKWTRAIEKSFAIGLEMLKVQ